MTAGTGIRHSEFNASKTEPVHFLQIWIIPGDAGLAPGYEQKTFSAEDKRGKLRLVASRDGRDGSVTIHQDADLYATVLSEGEDASRTISKPAARPGCRSRAARSTLNGEELHEGDGVAVEEAGALELSGATKDTEVLLFDLGA